MCAKPTRPDDHTPLGVLQVKLRRGSGVPSTTLFTAYRMADLSELPAFNDDGDVRVVVETPRGSRAKLKFDPKLHSFFFGWKGPKAALKTVKAGAKTFRDK